MKRSEKNKLRSIVGYLIIFLGIGIFCYPFVLNKVIEYESNKKIEQFFVEEVYQSEDLYYESKELYAEEKDSFSGILEIPIFNLKKGFYELDNINNNVDKNIEILDESDMPDVVNGTFMLAGHAGTSAYSHFKNLYKLKLNDEIYIYYNGYKYYYKITNIYDVEKTGKVKIKKDPSKTTLVLLTCRHNTDYQMVFIAELLSKEKC